MKKKSEFDSYEGNLRFDNLNFKLAVLQCLIYEKKVFSPKYPFEDFEEWCYADGISEEECDARIEKYTEDALFYFTYLKVPKHLAQYVTYLQVNPGDDIYYVINPEWSGGDSMFQVNKISEREATQFRKLKTISFWYMSERVEELQKQLKPHKIRVVTGRTDKRKSISPLLAFACMLVTALLLGGMGGMLFHNRYQDVEVTWSQEETETLPEETESESIEDPMIPRDLDSPTKELEKTLDEIREKINISEEAAE